MPTCQPIDGHVSSTEDINRLDGARRVANPSLVFRKCSVDRVNDGLRERSCARSHESSVKKRWDVDKYLANPSEECTAIVAESQSEHMTDSAIGFSSM